ncbi:hypothetical protein F5ESL0236_06235 [Lactobacillus sp. ESL0236]|uniref:hypothetical protein n=1 Tax=unclassified Lactobacillus TaxID=2620435 RepID=UPI000EFCB9E9|nr:MULTISPECIES: hypothetical protein [unclassified Lactobacillus]RMC38535.1 hypothetical protein F5ESL0237_06225 [Lactobacillus sp. ESL0237]RMC42880.1 hypothetical protein F5ESL0234_06230 [Lactobacillus sp. ESL0234]RMC43734.1 hypothetical protein F5ESL0236_06235 [Lactobacillus sp. ESL0236]
MMAAVKTQNQTRFRGRASSAWSRRTAGKRAVMGFLRPFVFRKVGIQDNKKIDLAIGSWWIPSFCDGYYD